MQATVNQARTQAQSSQSSIAPDRSPFGHTRFNLAAQQIVTAQSEATGTAFLVLLTLCRWADHTGTCYPGVEEIAKYAHLTVRGVQKMLRKLARMGELEISPQTSKLRTNRYCICAMGRVNKTQEEGEQNATRGCKTERVYGEQAAPEVNKYIPSKQDSIPICVPVPDSVLNKTGEGVSEDSVRPVQPTEAHVTAVSPPTSHTVQKIGDTFDPETRALAEKWFFGCVPREQWLLKLPLTKDQVFQLRCVMAAQLVPWPKPGSWLANQMRRQV
jgi:Helix-turn-helix domain